MPPAEFEPAFPASVRPETRSLDRAATGIGSLNVYHIEKRAPFLDLRWSCKERTEQRCPIQSTSSLRKGIHFPAVGI